MAKALIIHSKFQDQPQNHLYGFYFCHSLFIVYMFNNYCEPALDLLFSLNEQLTVIFLVYKPLKFPLYLSD